LTGVWFTKEHREGQASFSSAVEVTSLIS